jgi:sulfotransferase 6B1
MDPVLPRLRRSAPVRAVGLPLYRFAARRRPGAPPRVLANSLPKAGTHLLTSLLSQLPDMRYSGEHLIALDAVTASGGYEWSGVRHRLERIRDGQYVSAHLPAADAVVDLVTALDYACVFIVRDPRDVVVSDLLYILGFAKHPLHDVVRRIPTPEQRLDAMIAGLPSPTGSGLPLMEPIGERLDAYLGWFSAPATTVVRFENLVGPQGGGSESRQLSEIAAVTKHVGRQVDDAGLRAIAQGVWSSRSSTFRKGAIGDWRDHFTADHVELFKRTAGGALARYGYGNEPDW